MSKSNVVKVSLLGAFLLGLSLGTTNGVRIDFDNDSILNQGIAQHKARVHTLYLGAGENVGIKTTEDNLIITNGIVIGDTSSYSRSTAASIGGGSDNNIDNNSAYAGIAGGGNNSITDGENSIIGGGSDNTVDGRNAVIAGGQHNTSHSGGNVMGGSWNSASSNSVVLGGEGNIADENSLALGTSSNAKGKSFAWNATAEANSARINASNGILIGTTQPITGVNLVVNGATKIAGPNSASGIAGEIRFVSGCFYAYDGVIWHIINKNTTGSCNSFTTYKTCKFGNVELQEDDIVTAYKATLSTNCESKSVRCTNGQLLDDTGNASYKYAYCFSGEGISAPDSEPNPEPEVKCPATGACQETSPGGTCTSYTVNISDDCDSAKIVSKCKSDGAWDKTPGDYTGCDKCAEGEHIQTTIDPITHKITLTCVTNKCKGILPNHAHENNPNASTNNPEASYPSSPSNSNNACEWSCNDGYDWVKNPSTNKYECKEPIRYEWRFYLDSSNASNSNCDVFGSCSDTVNEISYVLNQSSTYPKFQRTHIYGAFLYFSAALDTYKCTKERHKGNNRNRYDNNISSISKYDKNYSSMYYGDFGVTAYVEISNFEGTSFTYANQSPIAFASINYTTPFLAKERLTIDFSTSIPGSYEMDARRGAFRNDVNVGVIYVENRVGSNNHMKGCLVTKTIKTLYAKSIPIYYEKPSYGGGDSFDCNSCWSACNESLQADGCDQYGCSGNDCNLLSNCIQQCNTQGCCFTSNGHYDCGYSYSCH